jgi:hypothetical protein
MHQMQLFAELEPEPSPYAAIDAGSWARRILERFEDTGAVGAWVLQRSAERAGVLLRKVARERGEVFSDND